MRKLVYETAIKRNRLARCANSQGPRTTTCDLDSKGLPTAVSAPVAARRTITPYLPRHVGRRDVTCDSRHVILQPQRPPTHDATAPIRS